MKKGILITLPRSDEVTEYLTVFSNPIIEECKKRGVNYHQIKDSNITKINVEKDIKSYDYKLVILNGHGERDYITGYKKEKIIDLDNCNVLKDRITYARSCWAAKELGASCMEKSKSGCFIGYDIPFMFLINTTWATNPIKDKIAKVFFDTSNRVPLGIIKGQKAGKANNNSKISMLKAIKKFILKKDKDSENIAEILWNNYSGQVIIGNSDALL